MKAVYVIFDRHGKAVSVSLKEPKVDPNTGRMQVLKKGETFRKVPLKSGQSSHGYSH